MTKKSDKSQVNIRMPSSLIEALKQQADFEGISLTELITKQAKLSLNLSEEVPSSMTEFKPAHPDRFSHKPSAVDSLNFAQRLTTLERLLATGLDNIAIVNRLGTLECQLADAISKLEKRLVALESRSGKSSISEPSNILPDSMTTDYEALLSRIAAIETHLAQKEQEQQLPPRPSEPDLDELSTQLAPLVAEKLAQQLTPISQLEQAIATLTQNCSQQLSNQETHFQQQLQHSNELIAQLENAIATAPNQLASHLSMLEQRYQQKFSQLLLEIDQRHSALEHVETVHAAQPPSNPGDNNGQMNSLAAVVELPLQPSLSIDAATLGPSYPDSTPITATLQQPTSQEALPLFTSSPSPSETVKPQDVTTGELKTNNSSEATTEQAASTCDTDSNWICLAEAFKYAQLQGYKGTKDAFRMKSSQASLKANPAFYAKWKLEFDLKRRGSRGPRTNWLRPTEPEHYRRLMGRFSGGTSKA